MYKYIQYTWYTWIVTDYGGQKPHQTINNPIVVQEMLAERIHVFVIFFPEYVYINNNKVNTLYLKFTLKSFSCQSLLLVLNLLNKLYRNNKLSNIYTCIGGTSLGFWRHMTNTWSIDMSIYLRKSSTSTIWLRFSLIDWLIGV